MREVRIDATPRTFSCGAERIALLVIDMQHEFLSSGGWLDVAGRDIARLAPLVPIVAGLIAGAREAGATVVYTRETYRPDLADCPPLKHARGTPPIGTAGPRGRFMMAGEPGNGIVEALTPREADLVIDKPGAGAFYATLLDQILRLRGITHLLVCGVTADVCVLATMYEGNDRGYECLLISDATGSYDAFSTPAVVGMVSNGVIGSTAPTDQVLTGLASAARQTVRHAVA